MGVLNRGSFTDASSEFNSFKERILLSERFYHPVYYNLFDSIGFLIVLDRTYRGDARISGKIS